MPLAENPTIIQSLARDVFVYGACSIDNTDSFLPAYMNGRKLWNHSTVFYGLSDLDIFCRKTLETSHHLSKNATVNRIPHIEPIQAD